MGLRRKKPQTSPGISSLFGLTDLKFYFKELRTLDFQGKVNNSPSPLQGVTSKMFALKWGV